MEANYYSLIDDVINNPETGQYQTYGIMYTSEKETIRVPDISLHKDRLEAIITKLNQHQLMPIHIFDVVEDVLGL